MRISCWVYFELTNISIGHSAQMEKTTRYYIWRDIICDILNAIESMELKESRVATENRVPTFLMDLSEYGSDSKSKSSTEDKKNSRGKSKLKSGLRDPSGIRSGIRQDKKRGHHQSQSAAVPQVYS